jgi:hypothetical protein
LAMCDLGERRHDTAECRSHLDAVYRSFTEGFETADLVRAKARLSTPSS